MKKILDKYKYLILAGVITAVILTIAIWCVGLTQLNNTESGLWGFILALDTSTAIALAVLAFFAYWEYGKGEDEIKLKFEVLDENLNTLKIVTLKSNGDALVLLRKDTTRAEVLGIMGMIQNKSTKRYEIDNRIQKKFLDRIMEVQKRKKDELLIPILEKDYNEYFDSTPIFF